MKHFNTTAVCIPSKHYMADLSERAEEIKQLVDGGKFFTINRARQYGKTTTIVFLVNYLKTEYEILSLDFQKISNASFKTEEKFVQAFSRQVLARGKKLPIPDAVKEELRDYIARKEDKAVWENDDDCFPGQLSENRI
ncbi:MAG: AAA-like domain-containing protein [Lachnospiraceae bacterium]|nr:AAA-like domain-containing protein [Lachnospiraceae bacterium]